MYLFLLSPPKKHPIVRLSLANRMNRPINYVLGKWRVYVDFFDIFFYRILVTFSQIDHDICTNHTLQIVQHSFFPSKHI